MSVTKDEILDALSTVVETDLKIDIVALNLIIDLTIAPKHEHNMIKTNSKL